MSEILEFNNYGVTLRRLTEDKIELVRHWRNHPKIQRYMEYREHITAEQQREWFKRINNDHNFYFIIIVDGKEIGLINVRDIDYDKAEGEAGLFIWDDEYLDGVYSFKASFCLEDFICNTLKLRRLVIHVLRDNPRAIKYNRLLGYRLSPGQEDVYNQEYTLDLTDGSASKYRKYLID